MIKMLPLLFASILLVSCQTQHCQIDPCISQPPVKCLLTNPPADFPDFTQLECRESWSKELVIANAFAQEQDFYRAITGYKRALFLLPPEHVNRRQQIEFGILLSYYLGGKYGEAIEVFENSCLVDFPEFPATEDLLIVLYDSYRILGSCEKAAQVLFSIEKRNRCLAERLTLSTAMINADLPVLSGYTHTNNAVENLLIRYACEEKSPTQARTLNAILPGAGYLYVGQKQTALTSLIINALFIAATYNFFERGYIAAGVITASLEAGWYLGGINGAGLAAQEYNERLYETLARETLTQQRLFPLLMLQHSF